MVVAADGDAVNWTDQNCKALDHAAAEDGVFWMEEEDFDRVFTELYTCMVCAAVTITARTALLFDCLLRQSLLLCSLGGRYQMGGTRCTGMGSGLLKLLEEG